MAAYRPPDWARRLGMPPSSEQAALVAQTPLAAQAVAAGRPQRGDVTDGCCALQPGIPWGGAAVSAATRESVRIVLPSQLTSMAQLLNKGNELDPRIVVPLLPPPSPPPWPPPLGPSRYYHSSAFQPPAVTACG